VANATYQFTIVSGGEQFGASVVAPPATTVNEFSAARFKVYDSYAAFDHLTLTFPRSGSDLAFYAAYKVNPANPNASFDDVTCTNLPLSPTTMNPGDLIDLVVDTSEWQQSSYTLDKTSPNAAQSCFPQGPSSGGPIAYAVGLGVGRKGSVSDNLFSASVVFAGTSDASAIVFSH
jgi:hypothetical protein